LGFTPVSVWFVSPKKLLEQGVFVNGSQRSEAMNAFFFLLPFLAVLVIFFGFAFLRTVYFSFTDYDFFHAPNFVGINNYVETPKDELFRLALVNTFSYSIIVTVLQTIGALVLAVILNQKLRGIAFFRTAYYMPSIASSAVITLVFIWLFRPTGIFSFLGTQFQNYFWVIFSFILVTAIVQTLQVMYERSVQLPAGAFDPALLVVSFLIAAVATWALVAFGLVKIGFAEPQPLTWLSSRERLLGVIPLPLMVIIIQNIFTTIPSLMLLFLAGLQGVSPTMYEAASIDGATPWQQTLFITIPMLRPVTFYAITTSLIGTLQVFDQIALFEGTAPLESTVTLAYYVYYNVFQSSGQSKIGLASASAMILALLTLLVVVIQRRFFVSDEGAGK
jgi:multiple sugar transport system permease protein